MSTITRYYGTGRRKTASARVFLSIGNGSISVNGRAFESYFPREAARRRLMQPLALLGLENQVDLYVTVRGGGLTGQADAVRLGLARSLLELNSENRAKLKPAGLLTRDARKVERKKAGLHKARRRPQYSKR